MKLLAPFAIASAIGLTNAWQSISHQVGQVGNPEEGRPRLSQMISHLEKNNKIKWEDQGL